MSYDARAIIEGICQLEITLEQESKHGMGF